jgi:Na+/melibiose symporter-like transporter
MTEKQFILALFASLFVPLIFSIPFWPRLLERYTFGGIFGAFFSFGGAVSCILASVQTILNPAPVGATLKTEGYVFMFLFLAVLFIIIGLFCLKTSKHPVSERRFSIVDAAIQGRWDLLEQAGVPKHEIEQLQRLTPQHRADLFMPLKKQADEVLQENRKNRKNKNVLPEDITIFPGSLRDDLRCRV